MVVFPEHCLRYLCWDRSWSELTCDAVSGTAGHHLHTCCLEAFPSHFPERMHKTTDCSSGKENLLSDFLQAVKSRISKVIAKLDFWIFVAVLPMSSHHITHLLFERWYLGFGHPYRLHLVRFNCFS